MDHWADRSKGWQLGGRVLDPTIPDVHEYLRADLSRLVGGGYQLIKHDFSTYDLLGWWGSSRAGAGARCVPPSEWPLPRPPSASRSMVWIPPVRPDGRTTRETCYQWYGDVGCLEVVSPSLHEWDGSRNPEDLARYLPRSRGFEDYWFGSVSPYEVNYNLDGTDHPDAPAVIRDSRLRVDVQTEAALAFLKRRKTDERPFFLYLA